MMNSQSNVAAAPTGAGSHGASVRLLARRPGAEASAPTGVSADGLLASRAVPEPGRTFSSFTGIDDVGIVPRTQLDRKSAAAEAMGRLGCSGAREKSKWWVSDAFWRASRKIGRAHV